MGAPDIEAGAPFAFNAQQLVYLREVARAATFTETAARLGVSQPALSQALAAVEVRLGLPLFERQGRRRVLTEAGGEVARFAGDVLGRAAELRAWIEARRGGAGGTLAVGMIDAASLYVLPATIRAFREAHPGVQLRLVVDTSRTLMERVRRFELDLAFVVGPAAADLEGRVVQTEPLYVYAPPGATDTPAAAEWALYPAGSQTRVQIDEGLRRLGVVPRVMLESSNPEVLRQVVALGLGWSVLPVAVAEAGSAVLAAGRRDAVAERTLLGVRRAAGAPDARAEAFLRLALGGPAGTATPPGRAALPFVSPRCGR